MEIIGLLEYQKLEVEKLYVDDHIIFTEHFPFSFPPMKIVRGYLKILEKTENFIKIEVKYNNNTPLFEKILYFIYDSNLEKYDYADANREINFICGFYTYGYRQNLFIEYQIIRNILYKNRCKISSEKYMNKSEINIS
jgi:hypothetical protein